MELLYKQEHLNCFYYDRSQKPQIEILTYKTGQQQEVSIHADEIVFFVQGTIRQVHRGYPAFENSAGDFIFLPCNSKISLSAISDSIVTVFRLDKQIKLCENYRLEDLFHSKQAVLQTKEQTPHIYALLMNERVSHFLTGVNECVSDGLRCRHFFELIIEEFFLMLRAYYTKEELGSFLRLVLSGDTAFLEHIRKNWKKYPTVKQMAASMNLSVVRFSAKFKKTLGQTAYQWLKQAKAQHIYQEINQGEKPLKRIAEENGFSTIAQFSNFCKKELDVTPSQIRKRIKDQTSCL